MYSSKFTFIQNGVQLIIEKDGDEGYGRAASAESVGGFDVHGTDGEDAMFTYSGGNYTFSAGGSHALVYLFTCFEQGLITYDHKPSQNIEGRMEGAYDYGAQTSVQYPFGYGLSYTTFEYDNLSVSQTDFVSGDTLTVSVEVTNSGMIAGKESVLLFSSDRVASLSPDVRRLRGFEKVMLESGDTKTISLQLSADDLAFVNEDGKWILEAGEFMLQLGDKIETIRCTDSKVWNTPNR